MNHFSHPVFLNANAGPFLAAALQNDLHLCIIESIISARGSVTGVKP
jgi:hypothetical protein